MLSRSLFILAIYLTLTRGATVCIMLDVDFFNSRVEIHVVVLSAFLSQSIKFIESLLGAGDYII